jgi:hypothetical protein
MVGSAPRSFLVVFDARGYPVEEGVIFKGREPDMVNEIVELSRTRQPAGGGVVIVDYDAHPQVCRYGVWLGWQDNFTETVVMSYEHSADRYYTGWSLNGNDVVNPGLSSGTGPSGYPVPSDLNVSYVCPVDDEFHHLQLVSRPGSGDTVVTALPSYRSDDGPFPPAAPNYDFAARMGVAISGSFITWPADKLTEEHACLVNGRERLALHGQPHMVGPGDPVESWLQHLTGEDAVGFTAALDTADSLGPADRRLAEGIRKYLTNLIDRAKLAQHTTRASENQRGGAEQP